MNKIITFHDFEIRETKSALGGTVTELLHGEKIDTQKNIDKKEIEELVVGSLDMAVRDSIHQHRKNWILAYLLCFFISITEIIMLVVSKNSL